MVQNLNDKQMMDRSFRLIVINSSVNVDTRSSKLYDLVEKDLLGPLDMPTAAVSPYRYCCFPQHTPPFLPLPNPRFLLFEKKLRH
jgi:hypothetical protein